MGNFREILEFVANRDAAIRCRLTDGPRNATYTSSDIQNEILNIMGSIVQKQICADKQKLGCILF